MQEYKGLMSKFGLGLGWLRVVAQGYRYSCNKIPLGSICLKKLKSWESNIGLGLGWLRVFAQGYIYNYNEIRLGINFKMNLKV